MAGRCHHFVQNAWKKDLCSNCFKSKEEHDANGAASNDGKSRYQSSLYSSRPYSWRRTEAVVQSILKDAQQLPKKSKGSTVRFPAEESEVIGYGGEENFSSDGEDGGAELADGSPVSDEEEEGEEAKALQRLTQDNTDFNTFTANLLGEKRTRSSGRVMLGKPLTDSEGRRQTLQVTITPFGGSHDNTSIAANRKSHFSKLLHDGTEDKALLKSVSKRDDVISVEEKSKNSCAETDETKDVLTNPLERNESDVSRETKSTCQTTTENYESGGCNLKDVINGSEIELKYVVKESQLHISEPKQETLPPNTHEAKTVSVESDSSEGKASRIPLSKSRLPSEKSKPLIRTTAFNGKSDLQGKSEEAAPKPTIRKILDTVKKTEPENITETEVVKIKSASTVETPAKDGDIVAISSFGDSISKTDSTSKEVKKLQSFVFPNKSTLHNTQVSPLKKNECAEKNLLEHKTKVGGQDTNNYSTDNFSHVIAKPAVVESRETPLVPKLSSFMKLDSSPQLLQFNKVSKFSSEAPCPVKEMKEAPSKDSCNSFKVKSSPMSEDSRGSKTSLATSQGVNSSPAVTIRKCDDSMFNAEQHSRELAGEPDGRADSDDPCEPPALPRSPPPIIDPRPSFLHGASQKQLSGEKPKIPMKPSKVLQAAGKQPVYLQNVSSVCQPPLEEPKEICEPPLENSATESRTPLKRQAPKPPPTPTEEQPPAFVIHKLSAATGNKSQAPVAREKGKRERASSCSPKMREAVSQSPQGPEPSSQRSPLSVSVESLSTTEPEAKKSRNKPRFSLRKFLRLGGNKGDHSGDVVDAQKPEDTSLAAPTPRPRLEIIHPLNLNGLEVQVVGGDGTSIKKINEDSSSTSSSSSDHRDSDTSRPLPSSNTNLVSSGRPNKPPPPPRNHVVDAWGRSLDLVSKPMRPPPPKSADILHKQKLSAYQPPVTTTPTDSVYANLGEVRLGLVPNKPQRTASIKDVNTDGPKRTMPSSNSTEDSGYESVELHEKNTTHSTALDEGENLYESVSPPARSSSPECDSNTESSQHLKTMRYANARRSDGCMEMSPEYLKFRGNFMRSTSLPYCGSETESDIYSPYSFCGSEDVGDDDVDWNALNAHSWRISKLRMRKGRSIVHKNLEDNYGAVVVANHEALAQVLEQMNQGPTVLPALRVLKSAANLCWADFNIPDDGYSLVVGRRVFHTALWGSQPVSLCITQDQGMHCTLPAKGCFTLSPLAEFSDLVPVKYLPSSLRSNTQLVQACVTVFPRLQLHTIQSYAVLLRERSLDECTKSGCFVLLQLVNALKLLQAQGTEETPASLSNFVLCGEERLCMLPGATRSHQEEKVSLCQCATLTVRELLPDIPLRHLVSNLLSQERATSLSQVKSVLEFSLWGPADIVLDSERELALQRWLDLERATVLHGLVRTRVDLTAFEECHLLFLVRTSAKMMGEASVLLDSQSKPETTSF